MNFKKWLQAGLISLCALALFGCASLENALSVKVKPQAVSLDDGLQSKLQKNQMALKNDAEIAKYQAIIAEAIKKDCQAQGSNFTPAPATGWATNKFFMPDRFYFQISENERASVFGVIGQTKGGKGRTYVLLPNYLYVYSSKSGYIPTLLKVPYSCMYNFQDIVDIAKNITKTGRKGPLGAEFDDVERDMYSTLSSLEHRKENTGNQEWGNSAPASLAVPSKLEPWKDVFANVYAANTKYVKTFVDEALAKNNAVKEAEKKAADAVRKEQAEKEAEAAKIAQEESKKAQQAIQAWDAAPAKARAATMKNKTVVFKSLYLGMPIEDAHHLLYRELDVGNENGRVAMSATVLGAEETTATIDKISPANLLSRIAQMNGQTGSTDDGMVLLSQKNGNLYVPLFVSVAIPYQGQTLLMDGFIEATPDGKVTQIVFGGKVVDVLFSAEKMDASTFADQFVKYYNIPRMDVSDDWKAWTYLGGDGAKLSISDKKVLTLERATGQKDLKKSFN